MEPIQSTPCRSSANADVFLHWDKNLIAKYDTRGPRYTSYPTAAQFTTNYSDVDYKKSLVSIADKTDEPLSLYVHIPFCQDICYYCACNKVVTRNKDIADSYLNYLEKEMALIATQLHGKNDELCTRPVTQLHLGGGSPTFLNAGQLTRLIHSLSKYFNLIADEKREYSIEIDPRTVSSDTLALLKGLGFNRISLGVQDFSPEVQTAINRINSFAMVEDLVLAARDYDFNSVNFDLIYGLPKQNLENLKDTLSKVIQLSPDRIAFYNYAHLPERFTSQRAIDRLTLPTPEEKLDMLDFITQQLTQAGYVYIGMDHFVKPNDALAIAQQSGHLQRNFQGYSTTHSKDLIGLGVSSISSGEHFFSQNAKEFDDYKRALEDNHLPVEKGLALNSDDHKRADVIMSLIGNLHFDIKTWEKHFNENFKDYFSTELDKLELMETDHLVQINANNIEVLAKGRALIRSICMIFDAYNPAQTHQFSKVL